MENELKAKYHYLVEKTIKKYDKNESNTGILVESSKNKPDEIQRITFYLTDGTKITHKPKIETEEKSIKNGFVVVTPKSKSMEYNEFMVNYPDLFKLGQLVQKNEVDIIVSYTEKDFYIESEDETNTYYFMNKSQFESIYIPEIHGDDKKNIEIQKERKQKFINSPLGE